MVSIDRLIAIIAVICVTAVTSKYTSTQPNIILIVADDLGWNDVSFHGSEQIPTPNIDKLAYEGVILFNYYVQPICTPTRSAIMTGRHPIHTGLFHSVITAAQPDGLRPNETTIPEHLAPLGYVSHMVGKWHLGHFAKEYLPINRGFNSSFGYYLGKEDYFDHTSSFNFSKHAFWGYDFHKNGEVYKPTFGQYSTELYAKEAINILEQHNKSKPLFLYLPFQAVHSANEDDPLQAPQKYIDRFPYIKNKQRKVYAAMVSALDDAIGNFTASLKETGLYDNSVILFTTDNGGPVCGFDYNCASNFPLRGVKATLWEGGVRGVGFVNSPLLKKPGRISEDLVHVCDWLPTIYHLAGGDAGKLKNLDGYNLWQTISSGEPSPRKEVLHNLDTVGNFSAIRMGDYKLVVNSNYNGTWDGWYPTKDTDEDFVIPVNANPQASVVHCPPKPPDVETNCQPFKAPCLFDIRNDACEYMNIAGQHPDIVSKLLARLAEILPTVVPEANKPEDVNADPRLHSGNWVPWINLTQYNSV
ncbi:arylsulfatase I-like isoform X2 [Anneissia japonica]|uniref:arylsulfatase I-like isoform X2 n=1 Tax=Anneissia japonica TaxID=1529436 RepID=UPI001425588E|nr:arylsulfatase I-like isoform X2 [Anneissia japonica]